MPIVVIIRKDGSFQFVSQESFAVSLLLNGIDRTVDEQFARLAEVSRNLAIRLDYTLSLLQKVSRIVPKKIDNYDELKERYACTSDLHGIKYKAMLKHKKYDAHHKPYIYRYRNSASGT